MDIHTLRLALALFMSLGLHAGLLWWQPPLVPLTHVDQPLSLQVSLLHTAPSQSSAAMSAEQPPARLAQPIPQPEATPSSEPQPVTPEQPELDSKPAVQPEPTPEPTTQAPSEPRPEPIAQPEPAPEPITQAPPETRPKPAAPPEPAPAPTTPPPSQPTARPQPAPSSQTQAKRSDTASAATQDNAANTTTATQPSAADTEWTPAKVLHNPEPRYPVQARRRGLQGEVVLEVQILANGQPGEIDIVAGSGHALLDQAALAALRDWRFQPARQGGRAVSATLHVPVRFELR